jgi:CRISPR-associated protein (TIGR02710 family)
MLNNAKRRFIEGKYNDAVMRLYRAMDIIAHAELLTKYDINKSNIDIKQLSKQGIKRKYINKIENQHRSRTTSKEIEINLTEGYFLLYRLNNKIGRYYYKNIELFTRLNRIRNKSILNHGKASLNADDYNEYETVTLDVARMFNKDIDRYMAEIKFPKFKIKDDKKYFLSL